MRAIVMQGKGLLTLEHVPEPVPVRGEALVEIARCGICGSDLNKLQSDRSPRLPLVLGHEFVGKLCAINVGDRYPFKEGDTVVGEHFSGCGICSHCRNGNYNVCRQRTGLGSEMDGVFAEYACVLIHNLLKVPENVPLDEAALVQPLAVVVHTFRRTAFQAGCTAAILGAGPIGALLALMARAAGGTTVVVTEPNPFRRNIMEQLGFPVIDPTQEDPISAALSHVRSDGGFDVVFDAAGSQKTAQQATQMVRVRGEVILVASYREEPLLGIAEARKREVNYVTALAHTFDDFRVALALIASRQVDVRPLITKVIGLEEIPEAFRLLEAGGPMMKVLGRP